MKRLISILLTLAMVLSLLPAAAFAEGSEGQTTESGHPFTDVPSDSWYNEYVQFVWENGLFKGTSDSSYSPRDILTRAMFVTVLGRMEQIDTAAYTERVFDDVAPDSWYGPYVAWAAQTEITCGISETQFAPDVAVSREQMAVFLSRYLSYKGKSAAAGVLSFADREKISDYAAEAVGVCSAIGVFLGDHRGNFNPQSSATRAEAAAVFARIHEYLTGEQPEVTSYCKVSFAYPDGMEEELKNSLSMESSVTVERGSLVYTLPTPSALGYVFGGWYLDSALTQLVDSEETVEGDLTLYPYLFPADGDQQIVYTPNFTAATEVSAEDFYVTVQAKDEETLRKALFIHSVTEGDVERQPVITDNGDGTFRVVPEGGFIPGGTYQFKALDRLDESIPLEDYIRFVEDGEALGTSVQFYNITVEKTEFNKLRLDDELIFISVDEVEDFSFEDTALIDLKVGEDSLTAEENKATGSFTYAEGAFRVGDLVAIHDGVVDEENPTAEHCDHISYVRITAVEGSLYSYEIPELQEVLFMPEVLPVPAEAEEGVQLTQQEDGNYILEVYNEYLDYSDYDLPALNVETDADVGDYIALYLGADMQSSTEADFYEILAIYKAGAVTRLQLRASSVEEIQNSVGLYEMQALDLALTEEDIQDLEEEIADQAIDSGFAEETAQYIADMLACSGNSQLPEDFDPESIQINVLDEDGNVIAQRGKAQRVEAEAGAYIFHVKLGKVDVEADITNSLQEIQAVGGNIGIRAELSVRVPLEIQQVLIGGTTQNPGEWNTVLSSLDLEVTASFVQEFAIQTRFSADEKWDTWFIFPYISEVVVDVNLDVGTYTGVGVVVTMDTGAYENAYDFDNFLSTFDSTYDPGNIKIGNLAKTLESMMDEPYKFFGTEGDSNSLLDDYREMMNEELEYVQLLAVRLYRGNYYITPVLKIVHIQLFIEAVISAKASINIGASFEHLDVKRHSFHIECFAGRATQNVTNLQNGYTNFNFYAMGNIGLRIGGRVDVKVGLLSVKLANLGILLETGPCLSLYGFFYFHYDTGDGKEPEIYHGGMYLIKIGWYLVFDFYGGAVADIFGFSVHLVEEEWFFWQSGDGLFVVAPVHPVQDTKVGHGTQIDTRDQANISETLMRALTVKQVDIQTGEVKKIRLDLSDFHVQCTNPAFQLHSEILNRSYVTVTPPSDPLVQELKGQLRLTYKHGTVPLSSMPIVSVINLTWTKTFPYGYIYFEDRDGNSLGERQTFVEGSHPYGLQYPDYTPPVGYDWEGQWEYYSHGTGEDGEYYYGWVDFDHETYVMKGFEYLYLRPVLLPQSGIPYKVEHYIQSLDNPEAFELYLTEEKEGTAGKYRGAADTIDIEGFAYNNDRSGGGYYYHPIYGRDVASPPDNEILGDGSAVMRYYYDRLSYSVYLKAEPGEFRWYSDMDSDSFSSRMPYGATVEAADDFAKVVIPGYYFAGWRNNRDPEAELIAQLPTVSGNMSYTAVWEPLEDTAYTVDHYIMQSDGSYELVLTQNLTGTTGTTLDVEALAAAAVAEHPDLFRAVSFCYADDRGFYDPLQQYEILGGGYTRIGIHYDRDYHRAYWYGFGDFPIVSYFYEGQTITAPEEIPEAPVGYQFSHWDGLTEDTVMGTENVSFLPVYEGQEGVQYTVVHVRQDGEYYYDAENEYYTETEIMYGKAGTAPTVNYRNYPGFTAIPYEAGDTVIHGDGTLKIMVKYQRNRYSLTLDGAGGQVASYRNFYDYGISYELPQAIRDGYTFVCWYLQGDESQTPVYYVDCYAMQDLCYVAKWEANVVDYKVEHYLQNLDGSYAEPRVITQTGRMGQQVTAQLSDFAGFRFDEGNSENVTEGYIASGSGSIADAQGNEIVLRLYYARNSYTVTWYDYDGSELGSGSYLYGAQITPPETMAQPHRTGYTFAGWNAPGTMGIKDQSFYASEDAAWTANSYTVRYDPNGGTGSMADQSFVYDTAQLLTGNAFQYTNRNFVGWSTTADGEVEYSNHQSVLNLAAEDGAVVTLYAVWELMEGATAQYTVAHYTQNLDGSYEKYSETTGYGLIEKELTLTQADALIITGFSFDPTAENVLTAVVKEDGSTVFALYYSRNSYQLTIDFGGEQIKVAMWDEDYKVHLVTKDEDPSQAIADQVISLRYGEDLTAYLTEPEKELGYDFAGWDNSVTEMPAEDLVVTAQWSAVEVTVTFHPGTYWFFSDEVDLEAAAVTETYRYGEEISPPEGVLENFSSLLSYDGYVEIGWIFGVTQANAPAISHMPMLLVEGYYGMEYSMREMAKDEEGNDLYDENGMPVYLDTLSFVISPFWASDYDVVSFDANGGVGSMEPMKVYTYGYRALPICTFTREGYEFVGWNTAPDGSGTAYAQGEYFSGGSSDTTTPTLYAQWEKLE